MCGIAGFWGAPDAALLAAMTSRIAHRGPDGEGFFEHPIASLGHRRLAIIDPAGGHQPVGTDDGLVQLTYNGEVYNFRELRAELEPLGHTFHTNCDTEVVLHAYLEWGTDCFARFNGMWALAILDLRAGGQRMVLARDHYGIKPLYYARSTSGRVLFASEAKAVLADPELETTPDRQWLYDYLLHGLHDHKPQTAFAGIRALAAATWAVVDADGVHEQTYWTPTLTTDAAPDPAEFRARFERSVERRLVADVPAGTCLSGGIDSSSIVQGLGSVAPGARARRGVARRSPQDVLDRLRRRSHRRARVHGRGARRGRRRARVRGTDVGAVRRRARPDGVAPGRTHRVDRSVRAVVRDAARATEGHGAAQRAGR